MRLNLRLEASVYANCSSSSFTSRSRNLHGCPCGYLLGGMKTGANGASPVCTCTAPQIRRYLAKISGPLLDRIDIHIEVPRLSSEELMSKRVGESSATVRRRVIKAREKQLARMGTCNGHMKAKELREHCDMDAATKDLLKAAIAQFNLSGRGYDRILKVSRTIADLEGEEKIEMHHVAEAINYRAFDRKLFG
ncbi:ATP-binding protein [bacterium]|nr:MAG: ATP-binding protein [bacterium]